MTKYDYKKLCSIDVLAAIEEWWNKLTPKEQEITTKYIQEMNKEGKSKEWVYVSLDRIKDRQGGVDKWERLLYYSDFKEETDKIINDYTNYLNEKEKRRKANAEWVKQLQDSMNQRTIYIPKPKKKEKKLKYTLDMVESINDDECEPHPYIPIDEIEKKLNQIVDDKERTYKKFMWEHYGVWTDTQSEISG